MQQFRKNLGKVSLTAEGVWDIESKYGVLSIVYDEHTQHGFISKQPVPIGVDLYNSEYWMPLNVSGYTDSNIIILNKKTSDASIETYTLEEAVKSIASVGRKPGCILGFYNSNVNRLDIGGRWEIWQFNSTTISEWEDLSNWQNIYYNYNQFVGWYRNEEQLKINNPYPEIGCYAYVGNVLNQAVVYRCEIKHKWAETIQHAWDYVKIMIDGTVTVGENGNWYNNGEDTGIPVNVKGDPGLSPFIRYNTSTNKLEYSYDKIKWIECSDYISTWFRLNNNKLEISKDNFNWNPVSDYIAAWFRWQATTDDTQANNVGRIQMSRDNGKTWTNMSNDFINNLHISRYIGVNESLPTSGIAEGTIYAKGPYYDGTDTNNDNPIYRLWVYAWKDNTLAWQDNGEFTSIAVGVVQETGDSETEVMSQKAVSKKLSELGSKVNLNGKYFSVDVTIEKPSCYIKLSNGEVGVSDNFNISSPIKLLAGQIIQVVVAGYYDQAVIALTDSLSSYYEPVVAGSFTDSVIGVQAIANYQAFKDCYIAIASYKNQFPNIANIATLYASTKSILLNEGLQMKIVADSFVYNNGYIALGGNIIDHADFVYTNPIKVSRGDIVELIGTDANLSADTIVIAAVDADGNYLNTLLVGNGDKAIFNYAIIEDGYISVSFRKSRLQRLNISRWNGTPILADVVLETNKIREIQKYEELSVLVGGWYNTYVSNIGDTCSMEYSENPQWASTRIRAEKGDVFYITGSAGNSPRLWALMDGYNKVLNISTSNATEDEFKIEINSLCFLVVNFKTSEKYSLFRRKRVPELGITGVDRMSLNRDNPITEIHPQSSFASIIHHWGFIGDSLSGGYMDNVKASVYDYSWGQRMCKLLGVEGYNFSTGGQTTKEWIYNTVGYPQERCWEGAKNNKKQGYIIALGVNDYLQNIPSGDISSDIGNYDDESDTDTNASTFAGYYAGIIQRLQSVQPNAKIFVVTNPDNNELIAPYNKVVRGMVTKFSNVYCVDLHKYAAYYNTEEFKAKYHTGFHMTALGYQYTAFLMAEYIGWIIEQNTDDFSNVNMIPL